MKERKVPLCRKCETRHYNVWSCERAAQMQRQKDLLEEHKREKKVVPRYRNDGPQRWQGDRLDSYRRAGNTYWRKEG